MNSDTCIIAQKLSDEEKPAICEAPHLKNVILNRLIREDETVGTRSDSREDES